LAGREQIVTRLVSEQTRGIKTAFLLAAATSLAAHNNSALAQTRPCRPMEYERSAYTVCEVDLHKQTIRLYWKRSDGTPYAYLSARHAIRSLSRTFRKLLNRHLSFALGSRLK
jgi:uncharacterized protein YigE (DUF2233 family)